MSETSGLDFDASILEKISEGIDDSTVELMLDESFFCESKSLGKFQAFNGMLINDTLEIVGNDDGLNDVNILQGKQDFEDFSGFLDELEESGEDLDPITVQPQVTSSSMCTSVNVLPKTQQLSNHSLPLRASFPNKSRLKQAHENNHRLSRFNKIYPQFLAQPSQGVPTIFPSQINLHLSLCDLKDQTTPTPLRDNPSKSTISSNSNAPSSNAAPTPAKKKRNIPPPSIFKYRDLSKMTDEEAAEKCNHSNMRGRTQEPFPVKLHSIIERSKIDGHSNIISWEPHGRSFRIHNEVLFVEKVLPLYFFQSQMSSFIRQLRMYGFYKIKNKYNVDKGCFFHELFLRGRPGLSYAIIRLPAPCPASRKNEPNLYDYCPMPFPEEREENESSSFIRSSHEKIGNKIRFVRYTTAL